MLDSQTKRRIDTARDILVGKVPDPKSQVEQITIALIYKPELLATGPNQVWTWDITRLKGPRKWTSFSLYVILDIFSRQVVGWMVADCESATLAKKLIRESCDRQGSIAVN